MATSFLAVHLRRHHRPSAMCVPSTRPSEPSRVHRSVCDSGLLREYTFHNAEGKANHTVMWKWSPPRRTIQSDDPIEPAGGSPKEIQGNDSPSSTSSSDSEDEPIPEKKISSPNDGDHVESTEAGLRKFDEHEEVDGYLDYIGPKNPFAKVDRKLLQKLTVYYVETDFILEDRPGFQYVPLRERDSRDWNQHLETRRSS